MKIIYPRKKLSVGQTLSPRASTWLSPAAWIYRLSSSAYKMAKPKPRRPAGLAALVVSVGNIEAGGGGKTPFCLHLLGALVQDGFRPVYVSRGFRSTSEKLDAVTILLPRDTRMCPALEPGLRFLSRTTRFLSKEIGDEGAMIASRLPDIPLLFSRRKAAAVRASAAIYDPTHIILDDAFQSWGVYRDLDVVLLDARRPFGNGRWLPAGTLREGSNALVRADWIGFNDLEDPGDLRDLKTSLEDTSAHPLQVFGVRRRLSFRSPGGTKHHAGGASVASLSSIARPERFDHSLRQGGCDVRLSIRFPDHHRYTHDDTELIHSLLREAGIELLVTTEKDWVKLRELGNERITVWIARLDLEITGGDILDHIKKPQG